MSGKRTILLIHGSWHTPAAYRALIDRLEAAGHEAVAPGLPSARPEGLADPFQANVQFVAGVAQALVQLGREVVCVVHSFGGTVAEALCGLGLAARRAGGLHGGIAHLVYVCAFMRDKPNMPEDVIEKATEPAIIEFHVRYHSPPFPLSFLFLIYIWSCRRCS